MLGAAMAVIKACSSIIAALCLAGTGLSVDGYGPAMFLIGCNVLAIVLFGTDMVSEVAGPALVNPVAIIEVTETVERIS